MDRKDKTKLLEEARRAIQDYLDAVLKVGLPYKDNREGARAAFVNEEVQEKARIFSEIFEKLKVDFAEFVLTIDGVNKSTETEIGDVRYKANFEYKPNGDQLSNLPMLLEAINNELDRLNTNTLKTGNKGKLKQTMRDTKRKKSYIM